MKMIHAFVKLREPVENLSKSSIEDCEDLSIVHILTGDSSHHMLKVARS